MEITHRLSLKMGIRTTRKIRASTGRIVQLIDGIVNSGMVPIVDEVFCKSRHPAAVSSKQRVPGDLAKGLTQLPFPEATTTGSPNGTYRSSAPAASASKDRGRVDIVRQTASRGGKTVTVVSGFVGIGLPEKERLARSIQQACGTGGTVKEGRIEIQGDRREVAARILTAAGFRPVFAGG
jgi:translation initiation factor 1